MPLYRLNGRVIFFVHIPKTGGSSLERAFRRLGCGEALHIGGRRPYSRSTPQHIHAEVYQEMIKESFYDFSFAIVRNPFDRIASEYKMRQSNAKVLQDFDTWFGDQLVRYEDHPYVLDNHFRPQHMFLNPKVTVFRYEDGLEPVVERACLELGIDPPESIPYARKGPEGKIKTSQRTLSRIKEFYERDFTELDYEKDQFTRAFTPKW